MNKRFYDYFNHISNRPFFSRGNEYFSYAFFKNVIDIKEKAFQKEGIKENDLVGVRIKDPIEFFSTVFSLWKIKATAVPFSEKMPVENVLNWTEDFNLNYFIENQGANSTLCKKLNKQKRNNIIGPGVVILTSGSSGKPKGVFLKEEGLFYSALGTNKFYNFQSEDRWGLSLPHHHIAGLMIPLRCLLAGASVILNDQKVSLPLFIQNTNSTYLSLVPHQLKEVINFIPEGHEIKSLFPLLKTVLVGGAFLSLQLKKQARKRNIPLSPTFGLSEMGSQVTAQLPRDFLSETLSSHVGKVLPYREMTVGKDNKILLGGKTLFSGYLSKEGFYPPSLGKEFNNLWQSQDLGLLDENSRLVLTGRQDKVFISGGENINPYEIETTLSEHDDIESSIVIPIPHFKYGQTPFAFYKSKKEVPVHDLESYCLNKLHPYKIPSGFCSLKEVSFSSLKPSHETLSLIAIQQVVKKNIFFKAYGDSKKPLVIFIHGFMGSHSDWDSFVQKLGKKYFCISLDLPGHGKSPLTLKSFEELSFTLKNLIQTMGKDKCYLIGYSLGGRIALDLFNRYPDLISGMVLESCHPGLKNEEEKIKRLNHDKNLFSHISNNNEGDFLKFLKNWYQLPLFGDLSSNKNFKSLLGKRMKNDPHKLKTIASCFSLGNQDNFLSKICSNKKPTLYITGNQDKKYTDIGKDLSKKSKYLDHVIIKNASHNTHFDKPLEFEGHIYNFLENLNP